MWEKGDKREREWKMEKRGKWGEGAEKGLEKRRKKDDRRGKVEGKTSNILGIISMMTSTAPMICWTAGSTWTR